MSAFLVHDSSLIVTIQSSWLKWPNNLKIQGHSQLSSRMWTVAILVAESKLKNASSVHCRAMSW